VECFPACLAHNALGMPLLSICQTTCPENKNRLDSTQTFLIPFIAQTFLVSQSDKMIMHNRACLVPTNTINFKGVVHFKKKNKKKTFANVIQDVYVFLSSAEKKLRFLMKTFQDFSPYNGLQWGPNGSRSKRAKGEHLCF